MSGLENSGRIKVKKRKQSAMQQAKESLGQRMIRKSGHRSSEKVMRKQ
jgi:hypothetical protein